MRLRYRCIMYRMAPIEFEDAASRPEGLRYAGLSKASAWSQNYQYQQIQEDVKAKDSPEEVTGNFAGKSWQGRSAYRSFQDRGARRNFEDYSETAVSGFHYYIFSPIRRFIRSNRWKTTSPVCLDRHSERRVYGTKLNVRSKVPNNSNCSSMTASRISFGPQSGG